MVLPAPDGPTRATSWPAFASKSMPATPKGAICSLAMVVPAAAPAPVPTASASAATAAPAPASAAAIASATSGWSVGGAATAGGGVVR